MVINPWDEYAAEEAILLGDRFDAESVAISMGTPEAADALKHTLAMGVNAAALVDATGVSGGDLFTTAEALANAVKAQGGGGPGADRQAERR
jgi:electron transfer flavoprotein beta subunit